MARIIPFVKKTRPSVNPPQPPPAAAAAAQSAQPRRAA